MEYADKRNMVRLTIQYWYESGIITKGERDAMIAELLL